MDSLGRNVLDKYSGWTTDLIKEDIAKKKFPYAIGMSHIEGDFNLSSVIRSANFFGANEIFYIGGSRRWDRRGAVGVGHYSSVQHLKTIEELKALKDRYFFVGLENNVERKCHDMRTYIWHPNSLILVGEEGSGLVPEILDLCDELVEICGFGSVRSLNAASAASIAMFDFISKYKDK